MLGLVLSSVILMMWTSEGSWESGGGRDVELTRSKGELTFTSTARTGTTPYGHMYCAQRPQALHATG